MKKKLGFLFLTLTVFSCSKEQYQSVNDNKTVVPYAALSGASIETLTEVDDFIIYFNEWSHILSSLNSEDLSIVTNSSIYESLLNGTLSSQEMGEYRLALLEIDPKFVEVFDQISLVIDDITQLNLSAEQLETEVEKSMLKLYDYKINDQLGGSLIEVRAPCWYYALSGAIETMGATFGGAAAGTAIAPGIGTAIGGGIGFFSGVGNTVVNLLDNC